jgi:tRNA-dihydrouridine synthase
VTAKIRLGWDAESRNYLDVARAIEDNGGQLIAVHGRTTAQGYLGAADWGPIGEIKAAVRVPVLGNGDVRSADEAIHLMRRSGCDGVMIGRAAMGNPWIFRDADAAPPSSSQVLAVIRSHLTAMLERYGDPRGAVLFRKHLSRYLDRLGVAAETRGAMLTAATGSELLDRLAALDPASAGFPDGARTSRYGVVGLFGAA